MKRLIIWTAIFTFSILFLAGCNGKEKHDENIERLPEVSEKSYRKPAIAAVSPRGAEQIRVS